MIIPVVFCFYKHIKNLKYLQSLRVICYLE